MAEIRTLDLALDEVEVVELHVAEGDRIEEGDPVLTLEIRAHVRMMSESFTGVVEKICRSR